MATRDEAKAQVKAAFDDGCAEINGRRYEFGQITHLQRRPVFSYWSHIQRIVERGDFSFMEDPAFAGIEKILSDVITYDGMQISKRKNHWDEFPQDYVNWCVSGMAVLSYPFLSGNPTVSE